MKSSLLRTIAPLVVATALTGAATAQSFPWQTLTTPNGPTARERVGSATDGTSLYLYGGQVNTTTVGYDNLLRFDGATWTELTATGASCGPRSSPAMAWDSTRGKLVVFGGKGDALSWNNRLNDTWEWDPTNGWVQMNPVTVPDARWFANAVFVPGLGVVFHGGNSVDSTGTAYTDTKTWAWDGTNWSVIATGPAKQNGALVYRSLVGDLVYFGGNSSTSPTKSDETWSLNLGTGTWSLIPTATKPISSAATSGPGLLGLAGYFNEVTGRMVIHGGQGNGGGPSVSTWEFDGTDWTDVSWAGTPNLRNAPGQWLSSTQRGYALCGNSSNGAIDWTQEHGPVAYGSFTLKGTDCPTSAGMTATMSSATMPSINSNLVIDLANLTPGALAFTIVGTSDTVMLGIPLPLPMGIVFPGSGAACSIEVSQDLGIFSPTTITGTEASFTLPVPNDAALLGLSVFAQGVQVEVGSALTAANTKYAEVVIGQLQ